MREKGMRTRGNINLIPSKSDVYNKPNNVSNKGLQLTLKHASPCDRMADKFLL
jgi:hypothetical protein